MTTREKFEGFLKELLKLKRKVADTGATVLVEGDRDRRSLAGLGLPDQSLYVLNRGHTLQEVVEELARKGKPVIVMTDWDGKGAELARRMSELLAGHGIEVDTETRRKIGRFVRGDVTEVEVLRSWAERGSEKFREPLDSEEALTGLP